MAMAAIGVVAAGAVMAVVAGATVTEAVAYKDGDVALEGFLAYDDSAKGGIVVAIRNEVNLPVKFIGLGENYDDVEPFNPEQFVEALFA